MDPVIAHVVIGTLLGLALVVLGAVVWMMRT